MKLHAPSSLLVALLIFAVRFESHAFSSAFTYQGRLDQNGRPASGFFDFRFELHSAATGSDSAAPAVTSSLVGVTNGLFTVALDFDVVPPVGGAAGFNGQDLWLEVAVRPAGDGTFASLHPRQPLTPAPTAVFALTALTASGVSGHALHPATGDARQGLFVDGDGNAGIGTTNPASRLHVVSEPAAGFPPRLRSFGDGRFNAGWDFYHGGTGKGYVGVPDSGAVFAPGELLLFGAPGSPVTLWSGGARTLTASVGGTVGIGTFAPFAKLEVHGDLKLGGPRQLQATGGDENLRIIRGVFNPDGTILSGRRLHHSVRHSLCGHTDRHFGGRHHCLDHCRPRHRGTVNHRFRPTPQATGVLSSVEPPHPLHRRRPVVGQRFVQGHLFASNSTPTIAMNHSLPLCPPVIRRMSRIILLGCLLAWTGPASGANRTWTGNAANSNWSEPDNWSPSGPPQNGDVLIFGNNASRLSNNNNLPDLQVQSIVFNGSSGGYSLNGNRILLNSDITAGHSGGLNFVRLPVQFIHGGGTFSVAGAGRLEISGTVTLGNNGLLGIYALGTNLVLSGAIEGEGGLEKHGERALYLKGNAANTYTGPTTIRGGAVHLAKPSGARAISADVSIGVNTLLDCLLADDEGGQYPPAMSVFVGDRGTWGITNGATVSGLVLEYGTIVGDGLLTLQCNVTNRGFSQIFCSLYLGGETRRFFTDHGGAFPDLEIWGHILGPSQGANPPGIIKDGPGILVLRNQNTYSGPTLIEGGTLAAEHAAALGTTGPGAFTQVNSDTTLYLGLYSPITVAEPVIMEGGGIGFANDVQFNGSLTLNQDCFFHGKTDQRLYLNTSIRGTGGFQVRGGIVRLPARRRTPSPARCWSRRRRSSTPSPRTPGSNSPNRTTSWPFRARCRCSDRAPISPSCAICKTTASAMFPSMTAVTGI
jgi:autotransporter-associated beta strand protein